jgi:hypothetical protein
MLDTVQLNDYMKKLQKKYPTFIYVGALPCDINPKVKIDTEFDYAYIYNTDPYIKPGQHWTALYIDNHPTNEHSMSVEFFDPIGRKPIKQIDDYIRREFKGYKYKINKVEQQGMYIKNKGRMEVNDLCGAYSCLFLERRIRGMSFAEATGYIPSDKAIIKEFEKIK